MADDLEEEWWEDKEGEPDAKTISDGHEHLVKDDSQGTLGKRKLSPEAEGTTEQTVQTAKKKRRRRKRITDDPIPEGLCDSSHIVQVLNQHFTQLSAVEAEDMRLEDQHFCRCNTVKDTPVAVYLKQALPKWRTLSTNHKHKMSPLVVVVCGNALRACNLNTDAQNFKGNKCKALKLFSRHMKIEDQMKALKKDVVHFAVGTPARLKALIQQGRH